MDYVQGMSVAKEDKMDTETCSESCQGSDADGSEFPVVTVVLRIV